MSAGSAGLMILFEKRGGGGESKGTQPWLGSPEYVFTNKEGVEVALSWVF